MMNSRMFPPSINSPTYRYSLCSLSYLCFGFAIRATLIQNWIAQMAGPKHRWGSRWEH